MKDMKLGLQLGYWGSGPPANAAEQVAEAERLGFDSIWTAEAYGSDALTPLSWWGSQTDRVRLGTALCQLSARTPTAMAMAAITLDHLSGGRFVLGLGVSGPQVVEGWYGQSFEKPLARTAEYVDIVRQVIAREAPGHQRRSPLSAPLPGRHRTGQSRSSPSSIPCARRSRSSWGPRDRRTWPWPPKSPTVGSPSSSRPTRSRPSSRRWPKGSAVPGPGTVPTTSRSSPSPPPSSTTTSSGRPTTTGRFIALYIGGMGAKSMNFHFDVFARMGYEAEASKIQELYLAGRKDEAAAAVPTALIEDTALIGPKEKIRDDLEGWRESIATTLLVAGNPDTLQTMAELVL